MEPDERSSDDWGTGYAWTERLAHEMTDDPEEKARLDAARERLRRDARVSFLITVGVDREGVTVDEARTLLHDACDALSAAGGPLLRIWTDK